MVKVVNGKLQVVGVHHSVIENKYFCGPLLTAIFNHRCFLGDGGQLYRKLTIIVHATIDYIRVHGYETARVIP